VAAWTNDNLNLTGHGEPLEVPVARVSPNFFSTLGVRPQLGRTFTEEEGRPEGQPIVMISDSMWRNHFGGNSDIIGRMVTLDTAPHTIVGVLPADIQFPFVGETDILTPRYFEYMLMSPQRLRMGVCYLGMVARLRPGTTLASAEAELAVLNQGYREQNPTALDADLDVMMTAAPLRDLVVAGVRGKMLMLSGAAPWCC
jgi:putative ABC transport system permease protein